jgi:hypothetical protein
VDCHASQDSARNDYFFFFTSFTFVTLATAAKQPCHFLRGSSRDDTSFLETAESLSSFAVPALIGMNSVTFSGAL